jgi:peptide/nickel transport system substrate-binding protein
MKFNVLSAIGLLAASLVAAPVKAELIETPNLSLDVVAGKLPSIHDRLPKTPLVTDIQDPNWAPGKHGGEMRMLIGRTQDIRLVSVYGYSRLVGLDRNLELTPDILESVDIDGGRRFTLTLRENHRWSDGAPFTSEDFRYWWEDVVNNRTLTPAGPPKALVVDGEKPAVTFPDARTVVFEWSSPNAAFLPALAGPAPLYIYRPAHYLRQFHQRYADRDALQGAVQRANLRNWSQLHNRLDKLDRNDNPDVPTLDPWVVRTKAPSERFVFERNPYYHRIDANGRQLPYIDRLIMNVADGKILAAKAGAGEVDLQARGLNFANYTFLRQAGKRNDFETRLWSTARGSQIALHPNLNTNDLGWRALFRDVRFRRALSLAVDRREINQVVYFGLAIEGANTLLPASPLYRPEYRTAWHRFDLKAANELLDEIGLTKRDERGIRLLPDGRPMEIVIETAGEDMEQTDVLELIHDSWMKVGIKLYSRPQQRDILYNRVYSGETRMSVWFGIENALATPDSPPDELAPLEQNRLQWPKWGQYRETGGTSGEPVDMSEAIEMVREAEAWRRAPTRTAREDAWRRMLENNAQNVWTIGLVANVRQPVVVTNRLRNVPRDGVWNWDPGAFFGVHRMDAFWFDGARGARSTAAVPAQR